MKLKVVRVKKKLVSENEIIPYNVIKRENGSMDKGDYRVIKEGKEGVREKVYVVSYEDGKEVGKQLVSSTVVSEPETRIVEYGTVPVYMTARGEKFRYKKVLTMKATAYTASYEDTGKPPIIRSLESLILELGQRKVLLRWIKGYTFGNKVVHRRHRRDARLRIAVAADIGSAVKGNVIDLYMDSRQAVKQWGVKR